MAATKISRIGFGQVEPNHLSAQRTSQIYAQLPAAAGISVLENGQFVKYDYAHNVVNFTGAGEWMMVFNEVKLYDDFWRETYKDYAMQAKNFTPGKNAVAGEDGKLPGEMVPRVIKINVGDIYTTNCLEKGNTDGKDKVEGTENLDAGTLLTPNAQGYLSTVGAADADMQFEVAKVYTLADGQAAVKVMRIK
jgi:hypothetical protein